MKVTYNWLKDFVNIKIPAPALAHKLTMAGLEVTSLEEREGDFVFEIEVTSNRPDCLSVIGIAREVAAITNSKLKIPNSEPKIQKTKSSYPLKIEIQDKKDCPLYTAKIIKEVKVGPSPDWLKKRLELVGCRSVNNIVDITNYILFAWGEPLHAFDLDNLSPDTIIVRRAKKDEKITTIDDQARVLAPDILVIADKTQPVAIAGIMGGRDSEVTESTKNILLEAAIFNPIIIRRGRQRLGMQTDSSYRFERGVDCATVERASWQATSLIQKICGAKFVLAKSAGSTKLQKQQINLDVSSVNKILGLSIAAAKIKNILNKLEFKIKPKVRHKNRRTRQSLWRAKDKFTVEVPAQRCDVRLEIDLIEEIARLIGYERIPKTVPQVIPQITASDKRDLVSLIKNILIGLGLNEVITYSLIDQDLLAGLETQSLHPIEIANPLSKEQEILRPTIIPSLCRCIAGNLNQKQDYINVFEVAEVFSGVAQQPHEELVLGIAFCGTKSWLLEQGLIKDRVGLLHLKGTLEAVFERLGIKEYNFSTLDNARTAAIYVRKEKIGSMTKLRKDILERWDIENKDVFVAEIFLDKFLSYADLKKKFVHLSVYPSISRDISLVLKEQIAVGDILGAIKEQAQPLLRQANVVDYYQGKQIPAGFKGLTISCLYRSEERTLTETEVNPVHILVVNMLIEKFGAQIR